MKAIVFSLLERIFQSDDSTVVLTASSSFASPSSFFENVSSNSFLELWSGVKLVVFAIPVEVGLDDLEVEDNFFNLEGSNEIV